MKTNQEIIALKFQWIADPCWDLEATEGFEDVAEELKAFRTTKELEWANAQTAQNLLVAAKLGCPGNETLGAYVRDMSLRLERLEESCKIRDACGVQN